MASPSFARPLASTNAHFSTMPHAIDPYAQPNGDYTDGEMDFAPDVPDGELDDLLRGSAPEGAPAFDINAINDRPLEVGEKLEGAQDYEDISDDDLASDEEDGGPVRQPETVAKGIQDDITADPGSALQPGPQVGNGEEFEDDLFGDVASSPPDPTTHANGAQASPHSDDDDLMEDSELPARGSASPSQQRAPHQAAFQALDYGPVDKDWLLQQQLFAEAGRGDAGIPESDQENNARRIAELWPDFDIKAIPRFNVILPPKPARYVGKLPLKPPRPVRPTKTNLELEQDQRLSFESYGLPAKPPHGEYDSVITIESQKRPFEDDDVDDNGDDWDSEELLPGGVSMQDLQIICADWDIASASDVSEPDDDPTQEQEDLFVEDDLIQSVQPARKKRKLGKDPKDIVSLFHFSLPSFDDPENQIRKIAQRVVLDLNDPHLLVEEIDPQAAASKPTQERASALTESIKDRLAKRYNFSNDREYDQLKQNHQHKIRSTLGNLNIEHSVPAVRLQYPFYRVDLDVMAARGFHRPSLHFQPLGVQRFQRSAYTKRKHQKGKKVKELYANSKDLSLADNSSSVLIEYSEEHPMMMSDFGMGNRIMKYYRRRNKEDNSRPKTDIGETAVLLPEDKSPFHMFGTIDPGETVTTLYNSMYRAPLFEQSPKSQDFIVVRTNTGQGGQHSFIRNIDHLYVAGQEFPAVDVPGPHSRKVTTAAKNRLKMISYRILKKKKTQRLRVEDVTKHFLATTDMQNRQKMKEFMTYSKEHKEWQMRAGDTIPDEETMQTYIRPEDVCLLESMQVGVQYLTDVGVSIGKNDDEDDVDEEDDVGPRAGKDGKDGQNLEKSLAPWNTSRNFLNATQGKAMLKLHGEGDPSGRGEAFSFIKTSMKGGFKAEGESIEDRIAGSKDLGGHSYNVARQQKAYEDSIRRIWDAQKQSLSAADELSDTDMEDEEAEDEEGGNKPTPRSEAPTPAACGRREDESASQFSKTSAASQAGKVLRIVRDDGTVEMIRDPRVIRQYSRRRNEAADLATK